MIISSLLIEHHPDGRHHSHGVHICKPSYCIIRPDRNSTQAQVRHKCRAETQNFSQRCKNSVALTAPSKESIGRRCFYLEISADATPRCCWFGATGSGRACGWKRRDPLDEDALLSRQSDKLVQQFVACSYYCYALSISFRQIPLQNQHGRRRSIKSFRGRGNLPPR